jgi:Icc-related predicted phosphoesterase
MKLKIVSDLHLNHYSSFVASNILNAVYEGEYDYIVMAGDNGSNIFTSGLNYHKDTKNKIISIFGNHEFYYKGYDNGAETNYVKRIKGQKFVCSTMFSKLDPQYFYEINKGITDFKFVTFDRFGDLYEKARLFLEKEVVKNSIVVTHFVPSFLSLDPQYKTDKCNSFFITELYNFIIERKPKLWVHGHTHCSFDYMIGDTRIICNPLGYIGENPKFNPNLIIDI